MDCLTSHRYSYSLPVLRLLLGAIGRCRIGSMSPKQAAYRSCSSHTVLTCARSCPLRLLLTFYRATVIVVFDPSTVRASNGALLAVNPFDTLAEFVGMPISFADEEERRLRTRVENVHVALADGRDLGTVSVADLYRKVLVESGNRVCKVMKHT